MSSGRKLTREEIWQRVQQSSKDEVILEEMRRLGFWPAESAQPTVAEAFVQERAQLETKLRELTTQLAKVRDPEQALKLLHQERKKAALEKREQTRRARNQERFRRASEWHRRQLAGITYLGDAHFKALAQKSLDHGRLSAQSLPLLGDAAELAKAMGITLNELRFLAYQRDVSTVSHYQRFAIPKKSGGERIISAPMPRLKRAQYWLLVNLLDKVPVTESAQGFVRQRNILTNALPHVAKKVVVNLDLENFFPSVGYPRVKGIFRQLGYSEEVATLCARLTTEAPTSAFELDGRRYFVRTGAAALPQGAPTSPALSNILCRRLDKRLRGAAAKLDFSYTRYADDLTFSSSTADNLAIKKLLWRVRKIIEAEGLKVHPRKTQVMRKHQRQEVTGVVVNEKPSVCREELRKFRALLFQIGKDGPEGKRWREGSLFNSIEGFAHFVAMVNPEKGKPLVERVHQLRRQYQAPSRPFARKPLSPDAFRAAAGAGRPPRDPWWQAQPRPAPVLELTQIERDEIKRREKEAKQAAEAAAFAAANPEAAAAQSRPAARGSSGRARPYIPPPRPQRPNDQEGIPGWVWWLVVAAIWLLFRTLIH
jgi:retron-type reverse transcriptase